jgi:hypothetical protein
MLLEAELLRIVRSFAQEGIALVVLKGVPLAHRLYGRLDARPMLDNDLLVRRSDVARAARTLHELGYSHRPHHTLDGDLRADFETTLRRQVSASTIIEADLHWNAFAPDAFRVGEDLLWSRLEDFRLQSESIKVFDPVLTVLHLVAHFTRNQLSDPKTLRDIGTAWNRWHGAIDSAELVELAKRSGLLHATDFALNAAWELGLARVPPPYFGSYPARFLRRAIPLTRLLVQHARQDAARTLLTLVLVEPDRLPSRLRALLLPHIETLAVIYGQPVTRGLYLRYLTRLFRPALRMLRGRRVTAPDAARARSAGSV